MKTKIREAEERISALEAEKQAADEEFLRARDAFEQSHADPTDPETPEFKALDEAGKRRDALADQITDARKAFAILSRAAGMVGDTGAGAGGSENDPEVIKHVGFDARLDMGKRVVDGDEYKALRERGLFSSRAQFGSVDLADELVSRDELKSLVTYGAGSDVSDLVVPARGPLVTPNVRPIRLLRLISTGTIDTTSIEYPVETVISQDADFVPDPVTAEPIGSGSPAVTSEQAGLKPETSLAFDKATEQVKTLAVFLPAFRNALEDISWLRTHINLRLGGQLDQKLEDQVLTGDGTGENFTGILYRSGIGAPNVSGVNVLDAIHMGITMVRLAYEEPTAVAIHPLDWETIRLMRDFAGGALGTGSYLFGPPSTVGATTVWGLLPVPTTAVPQGTIVVGDWSQAVLWLRSGLKILASDSHADFFRRNLVAILAELRAAFGVYKPQAFAKVTGWKDAGPVEPEPEPENGG
mgnify:FL=1